MSHTGDESHTSTHTHMSHTPTHGESQTYTHLYESRTYTRRVTHKTSVTHTHTHESRTYTRGVTNLHTRLFCVTHRTCPMCGLRQMTCEQRLVGSSKLWISFAKEPYKRYDILQKRRMILRSLLIVATPSHTSTHNESHTYTHLYKSHTYTYVEMCDTTYSYV